jgi:hypothetical protein
MQVDQRRVLIGAPTALVQPLAIQRQGGGVAAEPAGRRDQVVHGDVAQACHHLRRMVAHHGTQRLKALGVALNIAQVDQPFGQHHMQHPVKQRHIGARLNRQEQVGHLSRLGAARVRHDQLHAWFGTTGILDASKQNWVRVRRVRSDDEQRLRQGQVFVTGRRRVAAQRGFVAGHRAAHAQARIGVEVVGANQPFDELVEHVVVLGQQLP